MAPHLVRAQSAYKDIRIHSFHYTQTHTYTQTQTLHKTQTLHVSCIWIWLSAYFCIYIYRNTQKAMENRQRETSEMVGRGRANMQEDCWQPEGHLLLISFIIVVIVEATRLWAKVCWPLGDAWGVCKLRQGTEHVYTCKGQSHQPTLLIWQKQTSSWSSMSWSGQWAKFSQWYGDT